MPTALFRFYEELNDFLPAERRKVAFVHEFVGTPSVKDTIEAIGVPHTEIDLILVDGRSVGFGHRLAGGERVAVYPMFEGLDIAPVQRPRPRPLREPRFVLDVHLGTLARYLRLLGFDAIWRNDLDDQAIIDMAGREQTVDIETIYQHWSGEFTLLWQQPAVYKKPIVPGDTGDDVIWLSQQLQQIDGSIA